MTNATRTEPRPATHDVLFYDHDRELAAAVSEYTATGLAAGETVVVIATAEHRSGLEADLAAAGSAHPSGRLVTLDAAEALAWFCADGFVDPVRFEETIGRLIRDTAAGGRRVRVFGEMVTLLWEAGDVPGAIELETLWCGLGDRVSFDLLCAYRSATLIQAGAPLAVNRVCGLHGRVHSAAADTEATSLAAYPPHPASVARARHHLAGMLDPVGGPDTIAAALLIVTELATNAVRHAGTEFVVEAVRRDHVVRIAVRDGEVRMPTLAAPDSDREGGRGVHLVAALSRDWGVTHTGSGKIVWAEVGLP